ncbi:unnamed protein product [Effrenium voratum]|uniref:Uncharacterized protein n=1 Tax=Effrenium voratum TaxID=2562239 RepID=A0AA36MN00_9DINO|nr:unnamed protein product [Effrenium voratum]CAJ1430150.1 unnamed protein product [Effrenium voratum]
MAKLASATQGACGALPLAVEAPLAATQGACSTDANQKKHHRVSKPLLEAQPALDDTNQMTNPRRLDLPFSALFTKTASLFCRNTMNVHFWRQAALLQKSSKTVQLEGLGANQMAHYRVWKHCFTACKLSLEAERQNSACAQRHWLPCKVPMLLLRDTKQKANHRVSKPDTSQMTARRAFKVMVRALFRDSIMPMFLTM